MSSQLNIYIDKGTDFRLTVELFDENDSALPIADISFYGTLKKLYSTKAVAEIEFEKNGGNDEDTDPTLDSITLVLDADTTSQLKPGKYQYDVLMKKAGPAGEISKVVEGIAFVISTITEV
jgi:hypothetical protein